MPEALRMLEMGGIPALVRVASLARVSAITFGRVFLSCSPQCSGWIRARRMSSFQA